MLKIINIDKKEYKNKKIIATELFFDNQIIYLDSANYFSDMKESGWCSGVIKYNLITSEMDYFEFSDPVDIISCQGSNSVIYYAYTYCNYDKYYVDLRQLNCSDYYDKRIDVIEIDLGDSADSKQATFRLKNIRVEGISERYAIVIIPSINNGDEQYSQIILLDAEENKTYIVPDKIGEIDTLLRVEDVIVNDNNILFKTGNISWAEKQYCWNLQSKEYILENLICAECNCFIQLVKKGISLSASNLIASCDFNSAFTNFEVRNNVVKYQTANFEENITTINLYHIISKQKKEIIINGIFSDIYQVDNLIFGYKYENDYEKIFDLLSGKCLFSLPSAKGHIINVNYENKYVITAEWDKREGINEEIYLYNLIDNSMETLGKGYPVFNDNQKILTIVLQ